MFTLRMREGSFRCEDSFSEPLTTAILQGLKSSVFSYICLQDVMAKVFEVFPEIRVYVSGTQIPTRAKNIKLV